MFKNLLDYTKDDIAVLILLWVILIGILFLISRGLYRFFSKLMSDTQYDKILLSALNEYLKMKDIKKLGIVKKIILKNDIEKDYFGKDADRYVDNLKQRFLKNIEYRVQMSDETKRDKLINLYMCLFFIDDNSFRDILIARKRYCFIKRFLNVLVKNGFFEFDETKTYLSKYKHEYNSLLCDAILPVYLSDGFEKQKLILLKSLD